MNFRTPVYYRLAIFLGIILFSQWILPRYNNSAEIFILRSWQMFSKAPVEEISDLTWDEGKTFLLRDHRNAFKSLGVDLANYRQLLDRRNFEGLRQQILPVVRMYCQCQEIKYVQQQISYQDYIFNKKTGPILAEELL